MERKDWIKAGILFLAIVLTSFLFPRTKYFNYEFSKSAPWKFENLAAPYDFSLIKSEAVLQREMDRIRKDYVPIYQQLSSVSAEVIQNVIADSLLNNEGLDYLRTQFLIGIFDQQELESYESESIEIYVNGESKKQPKSLVNTVSKVLNGLSNFTSQDTLERVNKILSPNYQISDDANRVALESALSNISREKGIVKKGEMIARTGDIVTEDVALKLESLKIAYANEVGEGWGGWLIFLGYFLLTCLIYGSLLVFLKLYYPEIYDNHLKLSFILIWPVLFGFLVTLVENNSQLSTYLIPFCIVPIIIINFYSNRLALFVHIVVVLICSFLSKLGYEFTFLQILAGIITVLIVSETRYWNRFFKAIAIILGGYFLGYLGLELIKEGSFTDFGFGVFGWLFMNGVFLLLAYPFIPIIERIFGFTSSITLAELSDLNNKLLRDLSIQAPGTFQHSLQVANLAEAAVKEIGGNSLLTKVAGLYHDIGKMKRPEYYIENQGNIESPHSSLSNFESAKVIIDHVIEGEKMAIKEKLPKEIIDFIKTHHGTTRVEYFYRSQMEKSPESSFDESLFRYPGPKPVSKEQSVLMIADSIEAASKSLKSPTGKDIDELVEKIVAFKIDSDQLSNSKLTFEDLLMCKGTFKSLLRSIYHVRIEYPEA